MPRFLLQFKVPDVQPPQTQPYQKLHNAFRSLLQLQQQPTSAIAGQPPPSPWGQQQQYAPQQFRVIDVVAVSGSIKGQAIIEATDYTSAVAQIIAHCPILDTGLEWHLEELMPAQDAVQILEMARAG
jgi:hypothetical protein